MFYEQFAGVCEFIGVGSVTYLAHRGGLTNNLNQAIVAQPFFSVFGKAFYTWPNPDKPSQSHAVEIMSSM